MLLEYLSSSPPICLHCAIIVSHIFSNEDVSVLYVRLLPDIHRFFEGEWSAAVLHRREISQKHTLLALKCIYEMLQQRNGLACSISFTKFLITAM